MASQSHSAVLIIGKLREAETLQGKGMSLEEVLRRLAIDVETYDKQRKKYEGLRVDQTAQCSGLPTAGFRQHPARAADGLWTITLISLNIHL